MSIRSNTVFVSYSRELSTAHARMIFLDLRAHGFDVFMQAGMDDNGVPDAATLHQIEARAHFVVVLAPGIQDHWKTPDDRLRIEVAHALETERNVVPVLTGGFSLNADSGELPNTLVRLEALNGITLRYEALDSALSTLRDKYLSMTFDGELRELTADEEEAAARVIEEIANRPGPTKTDLGVEEGFARAHILREAGDLEGAIAAYTEAIELDTQHYKAYYNRGLAHYDNHSLSLAEDDFTEALRLNPEYKKAYYNRGLVRYARQDLMAAVSDFSEALRLDSSLAAAYNNRGLARKAMKDLQSAATDFSAAIRADPRLVSAYYNRASVRQLLDDLPGAIADYQKFLEMGGGESYNNRAEIEALINALQLADRPEEEQSPMLAYLSLGLSIFLALWVVLMLVLTGFSVILVLGGIVALIISGALFNLLMSQRTQGTEQLLRRVIDTSSTGRALSSPVLSVTSPFNTGDEQIISEHQLDDLVKITQAGEDSGGYADVVIDVPVRDNMSTPVIPQSILSTRPLPSLDTILNASEQHLMVGQASHVGRRRDNNQDAVFTFVSASVSNYDLPGFGLFIVADGMGGHLDGEKASALTMQTVSQYVLKEIYTPILQRQMDDPDRPPIVDILRGAVHEANRQVFTNLPEAGTTLTAAVVMGGMVYVAHVGDSRAYLITDEKFDRITRDHSLAERMVELGQLTPDEAEGHFQGHILYRAVGQDDDVEAETLVRSLPSGSYLLLCSDGLWGQVPRDVLHKVVLQHANPQAACDHMIRLANDAGGPDNITAALVKIV